MTTTESPMVSPGSREADTATPVTATHARDDFDILSPQQISARLDLKVQVYARRRSFPADRYQPRHEAREWGVRHSADCEWGLRVSQFGLDSPSSRDEATQQAVFELCSALVVSRVLPDGEWEVAS